jgi:unsaturated chondroitin disaccharide hydrolase
MIGTDLKLKASDFEKPLKRLWELSAEKISSMKENDGGAPVYTVKGRYTSRGWTEWTQGFVYGSSLLQFDATGEKRFLEYGRSRTVDLMATHVTNFGVHDHGFNNVSSYGSLLRLMDEGKMPEHEWERNFYELALKCSGAVQARRWTELPDGLGYIYSFNGPHSLFADTIRTLRALAIAHKLKHRMMGEGDKPISLLERLLKHLRTTLKYNVYYGEGRDSYDVRGRVAHESIFNLNDGQFRCPNSQQGYAPFTTWTRGLGWILLGCAEQLQFIKTLTDAELAPFGGRSEIEASLLRAAKATADFHIENTPTDGIPYWDTGAPLLHKLGDYLNRPAEPFNDFEPVDSSAAAITAQGLLRLGDILGEEKYRQAGLTTLMTLLSEPYISSKPEHQGLLLHSVYHRPNGWDYIPEGRKVPCGESSQWGDYHLREAALLLWKRIKGERELMFFSSKEA